MQTPIDVSKVTAVRVRGDRWYHPVSDFHFYGDGKSDDVVNAGATWVMPNGGRFTVPLNAIEVYEGDWPPPEPADESARVARPDEKFQKAVRWLNAVLHDNEPRRSTDLLKDAKAAEGIAPDTLRKAKDELKVRQFKTGMGKSMEWFWVLDPVEETTETLQPGGEVFFLDFAFYRTSQDLWDASCLGDFQRSR